MENAIRRGTNNTVGAMINDLGGRGVLNSSVTNKGLQGINDATANAMAQGYQQNIATLSQLYGQQNDTATSGVTAGAAAQEAAQQPALNLWNASLGLNSGGTLGALNAVGGQGARTSTVQQPGGPGLFGQVLGGLAGGWASTWCFDGDTRIRMADGKEKYIKDVKKGDKVLSFDPFMEVDREETVLDVMPPHEARTILLGTLEGKDKLYAGVVTTGTQPLLLLNGDWTNVADITLGTVLHGGRKVESMMISNKCTVYDLKVSGENTYYANGYVAKGGTTEW